MKSLKLHYAKLHEWENIPVYEVPSNDDLVKKVLELITQGTFHYNEENDRVYLLTFVCKHNKKELIFVDANPDFVLDIIRNTHFSFRIGDIIHIHEYESFEDAYAVALDLRESSDYDTGLTYNKKFSEN